MEVQLKCAKEMFEKLGWQYNTYEDEIYYLKWSNDNSFPVKNEIDFKKSKELFIDASVTLEELKAINKQIEELHWND